MAIQLTEIEQRVLGVLMEKALTQPGSYPLTLNAVLLGANQKQNREPVVEYGESDIARAVHSLQVKGLVKQAPPVAGARSNRFQHQVVEVFHWDRREQAVMAELLLRGRQTPGELRSRAERMTPLPDLEAVHHVLNQLAHAHTPFVAELPREPGRSANRWRHLLGEAGTESQTGPFGAALDAVEVRMTSSPAQAASGAETPDRVQAQDLAERLAALEQRVSELEKRAQRTTGASAEAGA